MEILRIGKILPIILRISSRKA